MNQGNNDRVRDSSEERNWLVQVIRLERVVFQMSEAVRASFNFSETSPFGSVAVLRVVINLSLPWPSAETGGLSSRRQSRSVGRAGGEEHEVQVGLSGPVVLLSYNLC